MSTRPAAVASWSLLILSLVPLSVLGQACGTSGCLKDHAGLSLLQHQRVLSRWQPSVHINNQWLIVNNKYYSRRNAHEAWLGRIGRTNGNWIRPVLINFRTQGPDEWFHENTRISTKLTLSSSESGRISAAISADIGGAPLSGDANVTHQWDHNASYVLEELTFDSTLVLKHWFNDHPNSTLMQDYMDMYSGLHKPRIVTKIWIMVRGDDENGASCTGGHLTLQHKSLAGHVGLTISGEGCKRSTWSFSPDTIIAYEASYLQMEKMRTPTGVPSGRVKDVAVDSIYTR